MASFTSKDTTGNNKFTDPTYLGPKVPKRSLILWELPHLGGPQRFIEMYINPQAIRTQNRKIISSKRTKGGFVMQYWGEELEVLNISGTTGDSGVEGLMPLIDTYRSEQLALIAIIQARQSDPDVAKRRQPLASLAASVVMWYQGQGKRGYFSDFSYEESTQQNGAFTYQLTFTVTETIGTRANFMPWHRKPWSTTETPNLGPGGLTVTGGYAGDPFTRLGRLNSLSGRTVVSLGTDSLQRPTAIEQWEQNALYDPKYDPEKFAGNMSFIDSPTGDGPNEPQYNRPTDIDNTPTTPTGTSNTPVNDGNVPTDQAQSIEEVD